MKTNKDLKFNTLLYDFYSSLLTERQREIFEDYYFNDLRISEISEKYNFSKPAAIDSLKKTIKILEKYETNLNLLEKFNKRKEVYKKIPDQKILDELNKIDEI